jgi:hypothetical protein
MEDAVPKNKAPSKPLIPQNNKDKKPFQKEWSRNDRLNEETRRELRRKNLSYNRKKPWEPGQRWLGKGKVHYIEVLPDSDEEVVARRDQGNEHNSLDDEHPQVEANGVEQQRDETKGVTIVTLSGVPTFHTFRVSEVLQGQRVTVLIDGEATQNFIDSNLMTRRGIPTVDFERFDVVVVGECSMPCTQKIL